MAEKCQIILVMASKNMKISLDAFFLPTETMVISTEAFCGRLITMNLNQNHSSQAFIQTTSFAGIRAFICGRSENPICRRTARFERQHVRVCRRYNVHVHCSVETNSKTEETLLHLPTGINMEVIHMRPVQPVSKSRDKPPIIFVHGSKHAAWSFKRFQPFFTENNFDTYAISMRGYGASVIQSDSENGNSSFTFDDWVNDLQALWDELNMFNRRPIVIAHSIGGFVVQKWAASLSTSLLTDSMSGLVLLASTPPSGNSAIPWRVLFKHGVGTSWDITRAFVTDAMRYDVGLCRKVLFTDDDSDEILQNDIMPLLSQKRKAKLNIKSMNPITKCEADIDNWSGAMLAVGGSKDVVVDGIAVQESARFWKGDMIVIDGAPHDLMLYSGWKDVAKVVLDWIDDNIVTDSQGSD